jgi:hypothetical protein
MYYPDILEALRKTMNDIRLASMLMENQTKDLPNQFYTITATLTRQMHGTACCSNVLTLLHIALSSITWTSDCKQKMNFKLTKCPTELFWDLSHGA